MKTANHYILEFDGLAEGIHEFHFQVDDEFFETRDQHFVKGGCLKVNINLEKRTQLMILTFIIEGQVLVSCDRCLGDFFTPLLVEENLYIKFGPENSDITDVDDVQILAFDSKEIDVSQHIYEYISLHVPYRNIHPEDEDGNSLCNKDMLIHLEDHENNDEPTGTDPRWDALKKFLN